MIWSLTYHNSRHIDIEIDTTRFTTDLQKPKFTKILPNGPTVVGNVKQGECCGSDGCEE